MEFKCLERALIVGFMLTSQVLSPGLTVHRGLKLWLLVHHVICAPNKLSSEINIIRRFVSWNDFHKSVVNSIISKTF